MPSKSKSQQRLFGMALAVRRGELNRSDVGKEVLDIVDGDMTDKQIEDFAKKRTSDRERIGESADTQDPTKTAAKNTTVDNDEGNSVENPADSPLTKYMKSLQYSGNMHPMICVKPDIKYVFVVVKPGFSRFATSIIGRLEEEGFSLYKTRTKMLTLREAKALYKVHSKEDFYDALCQYMSSDFSIGMLFTYPSALDSDKVFGKLGKTKEEIRKQYGESDMRNVIHSSDSVENMRLESSMYFNELI